ncbi:antibiotic biosynthesis monooxygenase family protein [Acaryochloris sp. IP29b_bin.148]|uniref:putative quinol monooxygenase n=1 Tax=Acaryochloris sp. IP29b_bin.148 TaxID=2969218 RepID=UPI002613AD68|nr:antibiotic biosynthesis monooxygenase family protein [Acaryochloris sp. IP29b_bin.148]
MIIITGKIKVQSSEELSRVKDALIRRARKSRTDNGNIEYIFSQNLEDPTELILTEKWTDETSLQEHLDIPDEEFSQLISSALIERMVVTSSEMTAERTLLER